MGLFDGEARRLSETVRQMGQEVQVALLARGWAVTDARVEDDQPMEFFWPPTAPHGYGRRPPEPAVVTRDRARLGEPEPTPWLMPTRIAQVDGGWRVQYGEATAAGVAEPALHRDNASLLADIEGIECWPMSVEESLRIRMERVFQATYAAAHNEHYLGFTYTEPYVTRHNLVMRQLRFEKTQGGVPGADAVSSPPWPRGDLNAQLLLIDAEAWASAVRTARAEGEG